MRRQSNLRVYCQDVCSGNESSGSPDMSLSGNFTAAVVCSKSNQTGWLVFSNLVVLLCSCKWSNCNEWSPVPRDGSVLSHNSKWSTRWHCCSSVCTRLLHTHTHTHARPLPSKGFAREEKWVWHKVRLCECLPFTSAMRFQMWMKTSNSQKKKK